MPTRAKQSTENYLPTIRISVTDNAAVLSIPGAHLAAAALAYRIAAAACGALIQSAGRYEMPLVAIGRGGFSMQVMIKVTQNDRHEAKLGTIELANALAIAAEILEHAATAVARNAALIATHQIARVS